MRTRVAVWTAVRGKLWIVLVVVGVLLTSTVHVSAQASTLLRLAVASLAAGTALESADAVSDELGPVLLLHTVALPDDENVIGLDSGSIVPALRQCPDKWARHVDQDGQELFFQFGLVNKDGERLPDAREYRILACVKP